MKKPNLKTEYLRARSKVFHEKMYTSNGGSYYKQQPIEREELRLKINVNEVIEFYYQVAIETAEAYWLKTAKVVKAGFTLLIIFCFLTFIGLMGSLVYNSSIERRMKNAENTLDSTIEETVSKNGE